MNNAYFDFASKIGIQNWIPSIGHIKVYQIVFMRGIGCELLYLMFLLLLKRVWRDIREPHDGRQPLLLTVISRLIPKRQNRGQVCEICLTKLSRVAQQVGLCISMQWLRFKGCHVACDEFASGETPTRDLPRLAMGGVASGWSQKLGLQSESATSWSPRVNNARDNRIRIYHANLCKPL